MIVEFVGMPGSGKSTVAGQLVEVLAASGVEVSGPDQAMPHRKDGESRIPALLGLVRQPRLMASVVRHLDPGLAKLALRVARYRQSATLTPAAVRVVDEGTLHRFCSASVKEGASGELLASALPYPELVVVVDTEPRVALDRIRSRATSSLTDGMEDDQAISNLSRHRELSTFLGSTAPRSTTVRSEPGTAEELARLVLRSLRSTAL